MVQRFFVRIILFSLLSMGIVFLAHLLLGSFQLFSWLSGSFLLLCIIYSGRWVACHLGHLFSTLLKYGFVALVFGSIPGIILVFILLICLFQVVIIACLIVGAMGILMELIEAIRMDHE